MAPNELGEKILALAHAHPGHWRIEIEPHDYADGTKQFTHVVYDTTDHAGNAMRVRVGDYVTPDLAEMMLLLKNNAVLIGSALINSTPGV
jgi:hypothetical protein